MILQQQLTREAKYQSVQKLEPVEVYCAINVTDGNGKTSSRLLFRVKGTQQFFFMFPAGTEENMRKASPWLQKLLEKMVGDKHEDIAPPDMGKEIPVGSPEKV